MFARSMCSSMVVLTLTAASARAGGIYVDEIWLTIAAPAPPGGAAE